MLEILPTLRIDDSEIETRLIRAPGPGGQKVNKTESAVQIRFDARRSPALPDAVFLRLKPLAGRRMTRDGVIVITANRFRSQDRNRRDALERLTDLIRRAAVPPVRRRPTRPTQASQRRLRDSKRRQSRRKAERGKPIPPHDQ